MFHYSHHSFQICRNFPRQWLTCNLAKGFRGKMRKEINFTIIFDWVPIVIHGGFCISSTDICLKDRPRFFYQVVHQTTNASIWNKHNDLVRLTKIMNNLVKDIKILTFKFIFQCLKLVESFQKKISVKNIWLGDQLLLMKFFENFDF